MPAPASVEVPRRRRLLGVAGVGFVAAVAAAAMAVGAGRRGGADPAQIATVLHGRVGARLSEAAAGLHGRVVTLAELPRVAAAVSTDAATVRDLTQDELAFRPRPGEVIAIGQIPRGGGRAVALLVLPEGAPPPALDGVGARAVIAGGELRLSEVVRVTPRDRADEVEGVAGASWTVPTSDLAGEVDAAGWPATVRVEVGGEGLAIGLARAPAAASDAASLPLPGGARLVVLAGPAGRAASSRWWLASALLALPALAAAAAFLAGRRRPALPPPVEVVPAPPATAKPEPEPEPEPGLSDPDKNRRIGRYELVRFLGGGGVAEVYLARRRGEAGFEKLVALKLLQQALARHPVVVDNFLDEARLASRLDHPNIVQILDLGRAGREYFIAMEWVDGADLARLIEINHQLGRPVSLAVALVILRRICDGLHAAHTARGAEGQPMRLVHRDVKSANVFIARNGAVKVGDFGIAQAIQEVRVSRTEIGQLKGTPGTMAPEHRLGQPVDARADLYGVGIIAYELLSGAPVDLDLARLVDRGPRLVDEWPHLPPLSTIRPDVPPALDAVIFRALSYYRDARHPDCAALEQALEAVAAEFAPAAADKTVAQWIEDTLAAAPHHEGQRRIAE